MHPLSPRPAQAGAFAVCHSLPSLPRLLLPPLRVLFFIPLPLRLSRSLDHGCHGNGEAAIKSSRGGRREGVHCKGAKAGRRGVEEMFNPFRASAQDSWVFF